MPRAMQIKFKPLAYTQLSLSLSLQVQLSKYLSNSERQVIAILRCFASHLAKLATLLLVIVVFLSNSATPRINLHRTIVFPISHPEFPRYDAVPSRKIKLLVCANVLDTV